MNIPSMRVLSFVLALTPVLPGCAGTSAGEPSEAPAGALPDEGSPADRPKLWLAMAGQTDDVSKVDVHFVQGTEVEGPRVLELRVALSGPVELLSAERGTALEHAEKEFIVQQREPGVVRLVAYAASNTHEVDSGLLARLKLRRTGPGAIRADLLTDRPVFAPAAAQQGLWIGDPLSL